MIPLLDIAYKFHDLFTCNTEVYGQTSLTGKVRDRDGKADSKSFLVKEALTPEVWESHLKGERIIGCTPLFDEDKVRWGSLDIDVYQDADTIEDLKKAITEAELPFVLCRSKSGGAHVYLFMSEPTLAKDMIDKLKSFSAFFGQGVCEIYPKQPKIGNRKDNSKYGNWINMPYSGNPTLQYAINDKGDALDPMQFLEYAQARSLSKEQFEKLAVPQTTEELLPEGPPCLNYIFEKRTKESENRNVTLSNVAVYLKKAEPSDWKSRLHKFNKMFSDPLPEREVDAIITSYERKDYKYQCAQEPLCRYCDAKLCGQRRHGIGQEEFLPNNRSLIQLKSDPPLWFLTLDHEEIHLTTEEFDNFNKFNQRVMEKLLFKYPPVKQEDWIKQQNLLLKNCIRIDVPFEMTPVGQFVEYLSSFCSAASEDITHIRHGAVKQPNGFYVFRMVDLKDYLNQQRFSELADNKLISVMKRTLKADTTRVCAGGAGNQIRCWQIHKDKLHLDPTQPMPNLEDNDEY
jgi:hypothetical protein